jgi:tRNA-dihydrouridine synthase
VRLPLRWIAILSGRISPSLAATGGVHTAQDAAKLLLAGADAVMVASAALERGPSVFRTLTDGLQAWLDVHGYDSVAQVKGTLNQIAVADAATFERAQYIHALELDHPWSPAGLKRRVRPEGASSQRLRSTPSSERLMHAARITPEATAFDASRTNRLAWTNEDERQRAKTRR